MSRQESKNYFSKNKHSSDFSIALVSSNHIEDNLNKLEKQCLEVNSEYVTDSYRSSPNSSQMHEEEVEANLPRHKISDLIMNNEEKDAHDLSEVRKSYY